MRYPRVLLKKERKKTRDEFSWVKFMFITCDKRLILLLSSYICTITVALYLLYW